MDACSDACEGDAGTLLADLERRQDDVLAQLDALDRQLTGLLQGLGVTLVDDAEAASSVQNIDSGDDIDSRDDVDSGEGLDGKPLYDERRRHAIKATTWDEPRWERVDGDSVATAARLAARCDERQDVEQPAGEATGFTKLPRQETAAALRKPRNAAAGRKRAA